MHTFLLNNIVNKYYNITPTCEYYSNTGRHVIPEERKSLS